ncbi:olfactory receptor 10A7-like isoform X1 [Microcaecilia unicolor]|uniref:Olfactory receptor n=1 Tax=Microcaecilia unicolor TaxID=1415580 RepID=A0A6P7YCJ0_9AMPH|nr:olfactory receptor 10A7-like isoform X1 [Microcaecilia unicolor]
MIHENMSSVTEFLLVGFSDLSLPLQHLLFTLFLVIYIITLLGNAIIIVTVTLDTHLHIPMYFFLWNLSILEVCYISVTIPKVLGDLLSQKRSITFIGCGGQMYFFILFATSECFLLAVIAYDRHVAICNPLRYSTIMSSSICIQLVASSWVASVLLSMGQTGFIFSQPYCGPNTINHYFCDIPPVKNLACQDTANNEIAIFVYNVAVIIIPFLLILVSYVCVLKANLRIRSVEGRRKAFSTCASHLLSVSLFYSTGTITYLRPKSSYSLNNDRLLSSFYTIMTPMFNPLIYSLRNKEVKGALRRILSLRRV